MVDLLNKLYLLSIQTRMTSMVRTMASSPVEPLRFLIGPNIPFHINTNTIRIVLIDIRWWLQFQKTKFIVLLYLKHLDGRDEHRLEVLDITVNINAGRLYIFLSFYWKQIYQWKMNQRHVHLFVLVLNALTCISYIARTLRGAVAAVKCLNVDFWKGWFNCNTMVVVPMIIKWSW